jgi:CHAT domain-containing protein
MHRGLADLRKYPSSRWLHNTLYVLANSATTDGMPLAAEKIRDEDVSVARRLSSSSVKAEALLGLADIRAVTERRPRAAEDLDSATAIVARMRDSKPRQDLEATIRSLRILMATDNRSIAGLDSAVEYFRNDKRSDRLITALLRRADVRRLRGELSAAAADLDEATAGVNDLSHDHKYAYLRAAVMERARSRFDQLVMLHVRAGQAETALQALERGRVSFAPRASGAGSTIPRPLVAPPGHVAVEYALIGDTLLTWIVRGNEVRLLGLMVDRSDFLGTIDRGVAALQSPSREKSPRPELQRLYDLLIRPVREHLGPPETPLVILADGEVASVPFDALLDSGSGRYLMEDHSLRFAATLADAARPAPRADGAARPALLVADPAFDRRQHLGLERLGSAREEVDSLEATYPENVLLEGDSATRDALTAAAPLAGVIHYAGHALFDDTRPERSALVLAGADTTGLLTAEAVNTLRLTGVRLVVLASCRTLRSHEGRSGGFAGLSGALLAAGAGGVVGSLWQADDQLTQPLMLAFHRAYRRTGNPAEALREAQREMLGSNRSPAAWAGFRYVGS